MLIRPFCCLLLLTTAVTAQQPGVYRPKLTNSKNQSFQDFPMGILSATGRLADGEHAILVTDVGKGGTADRGGLMPNDRITEIRGRRSAAFSMKTDSGLDGPQAELAAAIESAWRPPHQLLLSVQRGDDTVAVTIPVPSAPPFAAQFSKDCAKRQQYLTGIADHLMAAQRQDGSWKPGVGGDADVYTAAFCGLSLLAADDRRYLPGIKRAIEFVVRKSNSLIDSSDPKVGPKSWQAASTALLLAEYHLATGDASFVGELKKCCNLLAARVSPQGTMGHHYVVGYGGGGLVIINAQAHLAWSLAAECGWEMDSAAWNRSLDEIRGSIDKKTGAIGYSSRAPWSPDIAARTGAMAAALAIADQEAELAKQFSDALVAYPDRLRHAHAMSSIGLIFGVAGVKRVDPQGHQRLMQRWKPYLELCRNASGSAAYFGGKRNYGGDQYLGLQPIGNATVALMLASADEKLFIYGGKRKEWFGAIDD